MVDQQQNMMAVSDGVVIGIVLGLVFAAVSYYLYSRMGQLERKVGMMENILLDLKVTTEQTLLSATEDVPDLSSNVAAASESIPDMTSYSELPEDKHDAIADARDITVEAPRTRTPPQTPVHVERDHTEATKSSASVTSVSVNYESMTYKELVQLARQKGISGTRTMSKAQVIDALRGVETGVTSNSAPAPLSSWTINDNDGGIGSMNDMNDGLLATLDDIPESSLVSSD
jgi:predicted transcriptional regulator